jgi:hypothetical protein
MADPQIAYEALERTRQAAVNYLRGVLEMSAQEVEVLLRDAMSDGRIAILDLMAGERTRLDAARRAFLDAARHALDGEVPGNRAWAGTRRGSLSRYPLRRKRRSSRCR